MNKNGIAAHAHVKRRAQFPTREHWLVREALSRIKVRYWEYVQFHNPLYTGMRSKMNGGDQWAEFVIRMLDGRLGIILFNLEYRGSDGHNGKSFERHAQAEKIQYLQERNIPYLILPRMNSSGQGYEVYIEFWMKKEKRKHEKQTRTNN